MIRLLICMAPLLLAAGTATAQDHQHQPPPTQAPATAPTADPHAGHDMSPPPEPVDPHAGHDMGAQPQTADPHAGHDMGGQALGPPDVPTSADDAGRPRLPPPPPAVLSGPANAADAIWGEAAMTGARAVLRRENGDVRATAVIIDRLEVGRDVSPTVRLAFEVDDVDAAARAASDAGAVQVAPPTETPWRSSNARFDGPGPIHFSLFEELD